ncbi:hypothetical protein, partial [Mailhella sp.]|uniref:hypothetical protein n=1 Tax=Mailhella sp. TaxID=1981029 RepID=UPI0040630C3C
MLTKGAVGNLVNRYKAVLRKCNLINTFGSLAVASMLVLGGAGAADAVPFYEKNNYGGYTVTSDKIGDGSTSNDTFTIILDTPEVDNLNNQAGGISANNTSVTISGYKDFSISGSSGKMTYLDGKPNGKQHAMYANTGTLTIKDVANISIGTKDKPADASALSVADAGHVNINVDNFFANSTQHAIAIQSEADNCSITITVSDELNINSSNTAIANHEKYGNSTGNNIMKLSAKNISLSGASGIMSYGGMITASASQNMNITGTYAVYGYGGDINLSATQDLDITASSDSGYAVIAMIGSDIEIRAKNFSAEGLYALYIDNQSSITINADNSVV